jgi:hypothetical protein
MRTGEGRTPAGDLRKQASVSCSAHRTVDSILGLGLGRSRSGFRPTGVVEGDTGLPVEIHRAGAVSLQGIFYW